MVLRVEGKGIKGDDVSKMAPHAISSLVHGIYIPWLFLEGNPCWRPSLIHNQIWQRFAEAEKHEFECLHAKRPLQIDLSVLPYIQLYVHTSVCLSDF